MAQWLREHAPDVTVEMMYRGRPMVDDPFPTLPPVDEQIKILTEASERYAEVHRAHGVAAIAFPTVPIVAMAIRQGGPKEPFGEMITLNGQQMEEGKLDALPGHDSELLGLGVAVEKIIGRSSSTKVPMTHCKFTSSTVRFSS